MWLVEFQPEEWNDQCNHGHRCLMKFNARPDRYTHPDLVTDTNGRTMRIIMVAYQRLSVETTCDKNSSERHIFPTVNHQ